MVSRSVLERERANPRPKSCSEGEKGRTPVVRLILDLVRQNSLDVEMGWSENVKEDVRRVDLDVPGAGEKVELV